MPSPLRVTGAVGRASDWGTVAGVAERALLVDRTGALSILPTPARGWSKASAWLSDTVHWFTKERACDVFGEECTTADVELGDCQC